MKFKEDRQFATPEAAERKLLELANTVETDHAGRLDVGLTNKLFHDAGGSNTLRADRPHEDQHWNKIKGAMENQRFSGCAFFSPNDNR